MFSWGANSYSQLGQGLFSEQCVLPQQIAENKLGSIIPERVIQIVGGAGHSIVLDNTGKVHVCGWNKSNQLGIQDSVSSFERIPMDLEVTQIACGWDFSAAVTKLNELYVWGSNTFQQLGMAKELYTNITKPRRVEGICSKYVACGLRHSAIITDINTLQVCGSNSSGQLGLTDDKGNLLKVNKFTEIPNINNIKLVACGQKHTVAINFSNEVFVWGDNKWGQLGVDPNVLQKSTHPISLKIPGLTTSFKLYCGWTHNAILTEDGELWTWGRNNYGQLGRNSSKHWLPQKVGLVDIDQFAVGSEHNLAVSSNKLYTWGWNEHGSCGNGNTDNILRPTLIFTNKKKNIRSIGCGTGQSFAVT